MFFNLTPSYTMAWLHHELVIERKTLKEFEIIQAWQIQQWLPKNCLRSELLLFRTHFYIFHQLYSLKRKLLTQGQGDLDVYTLGTVYAEQPIESKKTPDKKQRNSTRQLSQLDGLLHYYLDWKPLFETDAKEIERLMKFAQAGISQPYRLKTAFKRFEITPPTSEKAIKQAYRKLAMKYHPDKGGNIHDIQSINEDKSLLMRWLQHQ